MTTAQDITNALTFNVAQLLKEHVGAERRYAVSVKGQPFPDAVQLTHPLEGRVRLIHTADGVLVISNLSTTVVLSCDRCLEKFTTPLAFELEEEFLAKVDIRNDTVRPIEDLENYEEALLINERHVIDLREVMRQHLLLALPMHPTCKANCAGLCPQCGKNLNEGPCNCEPEIDLRWAALSAWSDSTSRRAVTL